MKGQTSLHQTAKRERLNHNHHIDYLEQPHEVLVSQLQGRDRHFFELARQCAHQSELHNRVGAAANNSGACAASGCNTYRSRVRSQNVCSQHAEVNVMSSLVRGKNQIPWREKGGFL